MIKHLPLLAAGLLAASSASASLSISTVFVGDAGNPNDSTGFGRVDYGYHIGTYEVTNAQYTSFLNSVAATDTFGLYTTSMAGSLGGITRSGSSGSFNYSPIGGRENNPVNYVSFWDAARFTNWLTTGDTETGVYLLNGVATPTNNTITRNETAWANGGVAIASENEWYKAAYYQPAAAGGDSDGYWLYPTQSNSITTADANYNNSVGNVTIVGTYAGDSSYYGTFDQGGNVWEWNDEIVSTSNRGLRGGSFNNNDSSLQSSNRFTFNPTFERNFVGFRVSSLAAIPEPSYAGGLMGALTLLVAWRVKGRRTL